MKVNIQRAKGSVFIGKGDSNHWIVMDSDRKFGGSEAGSRPMEVLLISLGGCTGMDVESLINKMHTPADDFLIEITGERSDEHPKIFTKIHIKYILYGENLNEQLIKKAVDLSLNKYCPVTAMLSETAEISYEILINPERE